MRQTFPLFQLLMATSKSKLVPSTSAISSTCTRGLLMILSPAKTLNLTPLEEEHLHGLSFTEPSCNPENTKLLATILKSKSTDQLSKLLGTSAKLSQTVKEVRTHQDHCGVVVALTLCLRVLITFPVLEWIWIGFTKCENTKTSLTFLWRTSL